MKTLRFSLMLLFVVATRLVGQVALPDLRVQNSGGTMVAIHDVKLLHVDPDGIRVLHSSGSAKVPYELLPAELQSRFGFNAEKAQQHRDNVTLANEAAAAAATVAQTQTQTLIQSQTQALDQSTTVTAPRSTGTYPYTASSGRTSLGYTFPSTRNYTASSRRYNYCPSCTCSGSSYYYVPVYYYPVPSCGTTSTSNGSLSVTR